MKQSKTILKGLNFEEQLRYNAIVIMTIAGKINEAYSNPVVRVKRRHHPSPYIMEVSIECRLVPIVSFLVHRGKERKCTICNSKVMFNISDRLYRILWHTAKVQLKEYQAALEGIKNNQIFGL